MSLILLRFISQIGESNTLCSVCISALSDFLPVFGLMCLLRYAFYDNILGISDPSNQSHQPDALDRVSGIIDKSTCNLHVELL